MTAPLDLVDRKAVLEAIRPSYPCTQDSAAEAVCDALGDIETRIAALSSYPAPAGDVWQPISTAPKDGAWIMCCVLGARCPAILRWIEGDWHDDMWAHLPHGYAVDIDPTHWMPLPALPTAPGAL